MVKLLYAIALRLMETRSRFLSAGLRAIHRRMQLRCRRDRPRSAFEAQIRAERGTGSARAADADEFGTARELVVLVAQARLVKRRLEAGVQKKAAVIQGAGGCGSVVQPGLASFRRSRGSRATRPKRPGVLSSVVLDGLLFTVTV
jgi:hypothetical protein